MSKWKVRKRPYIGDWCVCQADDSQLYLWYFPTWQEALAHADRMARTVEVVLPRRHILPTGRHVVQKNGLVIEFEKSRSYPQLQPSYVVVEPEERRPLALALLALAEQANDKENMK